MIDVLGDPGEVTPMPTLWVLAVDRLIVARVRAGEPVDHGEVEEAGVSAEFARWMPAERASGCATKA